MYEERGEFKFKFKFRSEKETGFRSIIVAISINRSSMTQKMGSS